MSIGSFEFIADPDDNTRCAKECPQQDGMIFIINKATGEKTAVAYGCAIFFALPPGGMRHDSCLAAEKHEAERPAKWVEAGCDLCNTLCYLCSNCGEDINRNSDLDTCPGCGKRMVSDEET